MSGMGSARWKTLAAGLVAAFLLPIVPAPVASAAPTLAASATPGSPPSASVAAPAPPITPWSHGYGWLATPANVASSLAARIGTMRISQEIDALTVMGINPVRFIVARASLVRANLPVTPSARPLLRCSHAIC